MNNIPIVHSNHNVLQHSVPYRVSRFQATSGNVYEMHWIQDQSLNIIKRLLRIIALPFAFLAQVFSNSYRCSQWLLEAKIGRKTHLAYVLLPSKPVKDKSADVAQSFQQFFGVGSPYLMLLFQNLLSKSVIKSWSRIHPNEFLLELPQHIIKTDKKIDNVMSLKFENCEKGTRLVFKKGSVFYNREINSIQGGGRINSIIMIDPTHYEIEFITVRGETYKIEGELGRLINLFG